MIKATQVDQQATNGHKCHMWNINSVLSILYGYGAKARQRITKRPPDLTDTPQTRECQCAERPNSPGPGAT